MPPPGRGAGSFSGASVALVHDYLTQVGGAEEVVRILAGMYPSAPVITSLAEPRVVAALGLGARVVESPLGRVPGLRGRHRLATPLYPAVFAGLGRRASEAEVVIADTSAWAHLIPVSPVPAADRLLPQPGPLPLRGRRLPGRGRRPGRQAGGLRRRDDAVPLVGPASGSAGRSVPGELAQRGRTDLSGLRSPGAGRLPAGGRGGVSSGRRRRGRGGLSRRLPAGAPQAGRARGRCLCRERSAT
jgi:hypothetical protein